MTPELQLDRQLCFALYAASRSMTQAYQPMLGALGLARGVLTGKYDPNRPPPAGTRAGRQDKRMMQSEWRVESLDIAQEIKKHAEAKGTKPQHLALAWVLNNQFVTSVIGGPRTIEQWQDYLDALAYQFGADDEALIDRLVPIGHPSTPGYNDPAYPLEGRKPIVG